MNNFFEDQSQPHGATELSRAEESHEAQAPLLLQDLQSPQDAYGLPKASRRPQQAVVAVLLVVGAVGVIFAMRQFGLGPAISLAGLEVEYTPEASRTGVSSKRVLEELERSRKAVQVPEDLIPKDPFELSTMADASTGGPEIDSDALTRLEASRRAEAEQRAHEARQKEIQTALSRLELQSVMDGTNPMARISGQIVKIGTTVGDFFEVTAIGGREVTLRADGAEYVLSLEIVRTGQGAGKPKGRN